MNKPTLNLLVLLLLLPISKVNARVTIEQLLDLTLTNNAEIQVSDQQIVQAKERKRSTLAAFLPKVQITASESKQDNESTSIAPGGTVTPNGQSGLTTKATAQLNIFNGFQDQQRRSQREAELQQSLHQRTASYFNQRQLAIKSIFRIATLQADSVHISEKIQVEKEREKEIRRRVESQSTRYSDLLAIQTSLLSSQSELDAKQVELATEWSNLSEIAGRALTPVHVSVPDVSLEPINPKFSAENSPQVLAAEAELKAADYGYGSAKGAFLPSVDVSFNYYLDRPPSQSDSSWDAQITATLKIPLDGEKVAGAREARAVRRQKEIELQMERRRKSLEHDRLVTEFNSDIARLRTVSAAEETQERLVGAFRKDYQNGLVSISDYLNSSANLTAKKQERDRLRIQQHQRRLEIENNLISLGEQK